MINDMNEPSKSLATLTLVVALLAGCATLPVRTPVFQAANFNPAQVDKITLLPVLDLRQGKRLKLNLDATVRKSAAGTLKQRGYQVRINDTISLPANLTAVDLQNPPAAMFRVLAPLEGRWAMIFAVHDVRQKVTFGSTGNAEISAYLFDLRAARLVWRNRAAGRSGQGGLLGMAFVGVMGREALSDAVGNVLLGLPPRPKDR